MELAVTVIACFAFMVVGAVIGTIANAQLSRAVISPLLENLKYAFKHVSAHDLQVYHGINESDWLSSRPHEAPDKQPMDMAAEAERLAREFERMNGDLPPTAE